jgi:hypothetical protein
MRKFVLAILMTTALGTGAYHGLKDLCRPVCDTDLWQKQIVLDKVYVDFNRDGNFDRSELRTDYQIKREELALITFKEYGSRYLWIYRPGDRQPYYQIKGRAVGLGKFKQAYIPKELNLCCYLEKGASRQRAARPQPGNDPQSQKTLIRMDQIQSSEILSTGELELVTATVGDFVIQKDRARKEQARLRQYKLCWCR